MEELAKEQHERDPRKDEQRHTGIRFAIHLGDEIGGRDVEGYSSRHW